MLICGAGMVLASRSRAMQVAAGIAVAAALLLRATRTTSRHAAILAGGSAAIALLVTLLLTSQPGLALLARDPSFSARTQIWQAVLAGAAETPWLGHGYAAFWPGPSGHQALARIAQPQGHAHNGFLDVYAELGIIGLVLVCVPVLWFGVGAVRHALQPGPRSCLWPATYLVFLVASSAAESSLLRHKLAWALYVAAACHVAGQQRDASEAPSRLERAASS